MLMATTKALPVEVATHSIFLACFPALLAKLPALFVPIFVQLEFN